MAKVDVVIAAGHDGGIRNFGAHGTKLTAGTAGIPGGPSERALTPLIRDAAAEVVRDAGYSVASIGALYDQVYDCKLAVALHLDGSSRPCDSGASIGYPAGTPKGSNRAAAVSWRTAYGRVWPWQWMPDNFTRNLSGYYGYRWTRTADAELVLELGELTCPDQHRWLVQRIQDGWLGQFVGTWITNRLGTKMGYPMYVPKPLDVDEASPWALGAWDRAVAAGVFDGTDPRGVVSREELAVVLERPGTRDLINGYSQGQTPG